MMQAIRTSKRLFRGWLTLWLEDRRRARAAAHSGPAVPNAPVNLSASDFGTYIGLDWQDMSSDESGFHLYRKVDTGNYQLYQTLLANATTYQDSSVIVAHQYSYYVTAFHAQGESGPSNEVSLVFGA